MTTNFLDFFKEMTDYSKDLFTPRDKINCSFFYKFGACKHGSYCKKIHFIPKTSHTVILRNFYQKPMNQLQSVRVNRRVKDAQDEFDDLYEEIFCELEESFGPIKEMIICVNMVEYLAGTVAFQNVMIHVFL